MNILVINQPLNNRGDESAHKALIRKMVSSIPNAEITVLFWAGMPKLENSIQQFSVMSDKVKYIIYNPVHQTGVSLLQKIGFSYNLESLWRIHPAIRGYLNFFKKADVVVCAPGGMCMGGFQNWSHLFNLECAKLCRKPLAYYGRSFGPFPTKTKSNRLFKKISLNLLSYFSYLSIRDYKTQKIADELGIKNYVNVVDTAFLDSPKVPIPNEISSCIGGSKYFVFVPNLLIWHPAYRGKISYEEIVDFYVKMLKDIFLQYPKLKAVMLPQTFNYGTTNGDDIHLFKSISQQMQDKRIIVVDDVYSSDLQQTIISDAEFMIGARYHSVVFAINNNTPFIALNYEHKIAGLLDLLDLQSQKIDIADSIKTPNGRKDILVKFHEMLGHLTFDSSAQNKAKMSSLNGFDKFKIYLQNIATYEK